MQVDEATTGVEESLPPTRPKITVLPSLIASSISSNHLPAGATSGTQQAGEPILIPTEEAMTIDQSLPSEPMGFSGPARSLIFNRDGTITRRGPVRTGVNSAGKSLDVNDLLRTTDWSQTPLGPRDSWPQSLKTIGESVASGFTEISVGLVMQYPHQSCLWWGKELTLIYNEQYGAVRPSCPNYRLLRVVQDNS